MLIGQHIALHEPQRENHIGGWWVVAGGQHTGVGAGVCKVQVQASLEHCAVLGGSRQGMGRGCGSRGLRSLQSAVGAAKPQWSLLSGSLGRLVCRERGSQGEGGWQRGAPAHRFSRRWKCGPLALLLVITCALPVALCFAALRCGPGLIDTRCNPGHVCEDAIHDARTICMREKVGAGVCFRVGWRGVQAAAVAD